MWICTKERFYICKWRYPNSYLYKNLFENSCKGVLKDNIESTIKRLFCYPILMNIIPSNSRGFTIFLFVGCFEKWPYAYATSWHNMYSKIITHTYICWAKKRPSIFANPKQTLTKNRWLKHRMVLGQRIKLSKNKAKLSLGFRRSGKILKLLNKRIAYCGLAHNEEDKDRKNI